jgi:hypothetical protein
MLPNKPPLPLYAFERDQRRRLRNQLLCALFFGVALGVSTMLLICWLTDR